MLMKECRMCWTVCWNQPAMRTLFSPREPNSNGASHQRWGHRDSPTHKSRGEEMRNPLSPYLNWPPCHYPFSGSRPDRTRRSQPWTCRQTESGYTRQPHNINCSPPYQGCIDKVKVSNLMDTFGDSDEFQRPYEGFSRRHPIRTNVHDITRENFAALLERRFHAPTHTVIKEHNLEVDPMDGQEVRADIPSSYAWGPIHPSDRHIMNPTPVATLTIINSRPGTLRSSSVTTTQRKWETPIHLFRLSVRSLAALDRLQESKRITASSLSFCAKPRMR